METNETEDVVDGAEYVEETTTDTDTETTTEEVTVETKKPTETLEARKTRLERQLAQTNKKLGVTTEKKETKSGTQSGELDYGEKAYLTANGIKGSKEYAFVQNEMKKSGESLDSILENPYFQARLNDFRELNKTKEATITGKRPGSGAVDSVEYWAAKPIEEVPQNMRTAVVNHKLAKEKSKGVFYNS